MILSIGAQSNEIVISYLDYLVRVWYYDTTIAYRKAALVGEIAVPCNLQPATAGMNSGSRTCDVSSAPDKQR